MDNLKEIKLSYLIQNRDQICCGPTLRVHSMQKGNSRTSATNGNLYCVRVIGDRYVLLDLKVMFSHTHVYQRHYIGA